MPGISAVSPPRSAAPGLPAALGDAGNDECGLLGVEVSGGVIIEEEERLGALDDEVVDAHGDEVDADRVEEPGLDRELHLGADAVGGGHQDRVGIAGGLEVEQAAETADRAIGAGALGRADRRLDQVDEAVSGRNIDAGIGVAGGRSAARSLRHQVRFLIHAQSRQSSTAFSASL